MAPAKPSLLNADGESPMTGREVQKRFERAARLMASSLFHHVSSSAHFSRNQATVVSIGASVALSQVVSQSLTVEGGPPCPKVNPPAR